MWQWLGVRRKKPSQASPTMSSLPRSGHQISHANEHLRADIDRLEEFLFVWLLGAPSNQAEATKAPLNAVGQKLAARISRGEIQSLPRQTGVLPQLTRAVANPAATRQEIAGIVLGDPSLTEQLLHIANSPYFMTGDRQIESVDHAIFLLGMEGIRSVISAAIMRPMMAARNNAEARFAHRSWHWGISCARASELIAQANGQDSNGLFIAGLLPALAYLCLYREIMALLKDEQAVNAGGHPGYLYPLIRENAWPFCLQIAEDWALPARYHALLLEAQRPSPVSPHTPLNDGIILGTREVLRHAHQRNLPEEQLRALLRLSDEQFEPVRRRLVAMLRD